jgi:hypothetical protein
VRQSFLGGNTATPAAALAFLFVPAIQIRDVPPDLHRRLRERAAADRVTLSAYVLRVLERDAGRPSAREWFAVLADREPVREVDVAGALDGARSDRDTRAARVLRH